VISSQNRRRRRRHRYRQQRQKYSPEQNTQSKIKEIKQSILTMTDFNELKAIITTYAFMVIIGAIRIRDCFLKFSLEYFMLNSVL